LGVIGRYLCDHVTWRIGSFRHDQSAHTVVSRSKMNRSVERIIAIQGDSVKVIIPTQHFCNAKVALGISQRTISERTIQGHFCTFQADSCIVTAYHMAAYRDGNTLCEVEIQDSVLTCHYGCGGSLRFIAKLGGGYCVGSSVDIGKSIFSQRRCDRIIDGIIDH